MRLTRLLRHVVSIGLCLLWLTVLTAAWSSAAGRSARRQTTPIIYVGAQKIRVPPIVVHGRVLVPVRGVFEAIGADVAYSSPHFVVVRKDAAVIAAFILGRTHAIAGHRAIELEAPPERHGGRVYVPLRVVAEAAGATVSYTSRPPIVHIWQPVAAVAANVTRSNAPPSEATAESDPRPSSSMAKWRAGVAIVTGLCCLGCLILTARRFAPTLFRQLPAKRHPAAASESAAATRDIPPADSVALLSVESSGEARLHKQLVTETRTVEVLVTREELVIEYAGEGGTVIVQGQPLEAGETVRIPLWEERVHVNLTRHAILTEDLVIGKRRVTADAPAIQRAPDADIAEGSPS